MPVKITDLTPNQVALCRDLGARVTATTATWPGHPDDAAAEAWEAYRKAGYDGLVQLRTRDAQNLHSIWRKLEKAAKRLAAQPAVAEAARQETEAALRAALEANVWSAWADTSRAADAASCQLARLAEANDPQAVTMMNALDQMRLAEAALNAALGLLAGKAGA